MSGFEKFATNLADKIKMDEPFVCKQINKTWKKVARKLKKVMPKGRGSTG